MRKVHNEDTTVEKEIVDDVFCDKCGESMHLHTLESKSLDDWVQVTGGQARFDFQYGSDKDGDIYKVELCDGCCDDFFNSLKHKPEVTHESFFGKPVS